MLRWTTYLFLALAAVMIQHSLLGGARFAPDLPLAMVAWAVVDGTTTGFVARAWWVGMIRDACDPGALLFQTAGNPVGFALFHTAGYFLIALAFWPLRGLVFRRRGLGWGLVAAAANVVLAIADGLIGGFGDATTFSILVNAVLTAIAAMAIGWMAGILPPWLSPVGRDGA